MMLYIWLAKSKESSKMMLEASKMVLEGPPRWPGVANETPTQEATASRAPSLAGGGHRTPSLYFINKIYN